MNPPPLRSASGSQRSGLALASLILGVCGIVLCLGPLAGIPAVICGHMAHSRIKQSGGALSGEGMATAGLVTGYLSFVMIFVIGLLAAIAIPNFVKARQHAQYYACQSCLKAIQGAKETWATENSKPKDAVPTDVELFGPSKYLSHKPICPAGGIYTINAVQENPTCSEHGGLREK